MRFLASLSLAVLVGCSSSRVSDDLTGEWLGLRGFDASGSVFHFTGGHKLFAHSVGSDSTTEMEFQYDKSSGELTLIFKGETVARGEVKELNSDYLEILTEESATLRFVKVRDVALNIGRTEFLEKLQNTSWILKHEFGTLRMDFLSLPSRENKHRPFDAMHHWIELPNKDLASWNVGSYDGKLFLFSTHATEDITQQVLEVGPDRIVLSVPVVESAGKVQVMERTQKQSQDLIDRLTSSPLASVHTDTTWCEEMGTTPFEDNDAKDVQSMLKRIDLTFSSNKNYSLTADGQMWKSGRWKMSSDNAYIIFDDELDRFNWLEVRQDEGHFVLNKLQKIKTGDRKYRVYMLAIKMK